MSSSARRPHPGPSRHAGEARETSNERRHRLLCQTDTVLATIDDLLTATRCHSAVTRAPAFRPDGRGR
jgi:hypothetical protein